jgi:putative restriction endonuclease
LGRASGIDLPFHHLRTQKFWQTRTQDNRPSNSADTTHSIDIDSDFFECLQNKDFLKQARIVLIREWFAKNEQASLLSALGITPAEARKAEFRLREVPKEYAAKGRDARFRIHVVTQYRFTCALTGFGAHTTSGATLVEAAHIDAFSKSRNDNPDNGLALSRDAHWMFDNHLWTIDEKFRVVVAKEIFTEWGPEAYWLKNRHGQKLHFMDGVDLRPNPENVARHRQKYAEAA